MQKHSNMTPKGADYCLEWHGYKDRAGYGLKRVKWPNGETKMELTHRLSWMLAHQVPTWDVPRQSVCGETLEVSHICHNKACIRDSHLVLETHSTNMERLQCQINGVCRPNHDPACLL